MQRTAGPRTADPTFSRAAHPDPSPLRGAPHPDRALLGAPCQGLSFPRDISQVSLPSPLKSPALRRRILSRRLLPGDPEIRRENTSTALSLAKPVRFRGSASCRQALSICTYYQKSYVVTGQIGTDFSACFDSSLPADRFENARGGKIRIKRIRSQRSRLPWSLPRSLWLKYGLLSTEQPCQG